MIPCGDRTILEWALEPFDLPEANVVFIVQKQHVLEFAIDEFLKRKFGTDIKIVTTEGLTDGAPCTCKLGYKHLIHDIPLVIYTPDVYVEPKFNLEQYKKFDAALLTFKANSPAHSYARLNEHGYVIETKEKVVISDNAAVGLYYFKNPLMFLEHTNSMINADDRTNGEFYICPVYNYILKQGYHVGVIPSTKMYVLGTPADLEFYDTTAFNSNFVVGLCSDHSGFKAKEIMIKALSANDIPFVDYGAFSDKDCDYNNYVKQAAIQLKKGIVTHIFGTCRSGQGVNMCANKIKGIRSALIYDEEACKYAVEHNSANMFSFPSKHLNEEKFLAYVAMIRSSSFDGGRHYNRISNI